MIASARAVSLAQRLDEAGISTPVGQFSWHAEAVSDVIENISPAQLCAPGEFLGLRVHNHAFGRRRRARGNEISASPLDAHST
jgi:hypothetical protein